LDSASELLSISKHVDGLILTVRAGVTSKGSFMDLMENLRTGNAPIAGIVFNGCIPGATNGTYGYGYRYGAYSNSYSYRYSSNSDKTGNASKHKKQRSRDSSWYLRRYKQDIRQRGHQKTNLDEAVLAFGKQSSYHSLSEWSKSINFNPVTGVNSSKFHVDDDILSQIEGDKDSVGKK
jgi:hypothetical protein